MVGQMDDRTVVLMAVMMAENLVELTVEKMVGLKAVETDD